MSDTSYYNLYTPPKQPRRKRGVVLMICGVLILTYVGSALMWPLQSIQAQNTRNIELPGASNISIAWPTYGQSAAYAPGYGLLGTSGSDKPVPMASITKLVTALTILESKPLGDDDTQDEMITFTAEDATRYNDYLGQNGSVAPVTPGNSLSQRDMLTVMLVGSANNYADSLALWAFGSDETFLEAANLYLAKHELSDTKVVDATGFSPDNRSTARDLVKLGELALAQTVIAEAVGTKELAVEELGTFQNTNLLLQQDNDVKGIKTGTTDEAGSCLLYAKDFTVGGDVVTIIGATLGAPGHTRLAADAGRLMDTVHTGFAKSKLADEGQVFASYRTPWGETASAVSPAVVNKVVWRGSELETDIQTKDIGHKEVSTDIGIVTFSQNDETITTIELELDKPLQGPSWWWRLSNPQTIFVRQEAR